MPRPRHAYPGVLHAARYRTRCPGCGILLQPGLPIFKLPRGWGCYDCHVAPARRQEVGTAVAELREDIERWSHTPDRCDQPARMLAPPG